LTASINSATNGLASSLNTTIINATNGLAAYNAATYYLNSNPSGYITASSPAFTSQASQVSANTANIAQNANNITTLSNTIAAGTPNATPNTLVTRDGTASFTATNITVNGVLNLATTTADSTQGEINQNGAPLLHTYGSTNVFLGLSAGNFSMTGDHNIGMGANVLQSNTTGYANVGLGWNALGANTTGAGNIGIGNYVLLSNQTSLANIGIGSSALQSLVTGNYNVGIGTFSLVDKDGARCLAQLLVFV